MSVILEGRHPGCLSAPKPGGISAGKPVLVLDHSIFVVRLFKLNGTYTPITQPRAKMWIFARFFKLLTRFPQRLLRKDPNCIMPLFWENSHFLGGRGSFLGQ